MKVVHCEAFGKTGCRRIVPGEYICTDPQVCKYHIYITARHVYINYLVSIRFTLFKLGSIGILTVCLRVRHS
jgi:hypothetical protein